MDLELDPRELAFSERLEKWLNSVRPPAALRDYGATPTAEDVPAGREWQRMLHAGGWAGLSWPEPYGAGATVAEQALYAEALARRGLPRQLSFVSTELAGPVLIAFGTDPQKQRLAPLLTGDELWCQLFSEPGAGSDLASLSTRARSTADGGWRVTGQKVWTSGAHYADWGMLLARTDPDSARHRGITCYALPMDRAGIDVRPIRQLDGEAKFNEVFLDDVRVEPADVLGEVGRGWTVALSILGRERRMLGSLAIGLGATLVSVREAADSAGLADAVFRDRWSRLVVRVRLLRWTWFRLLSTSDTGPPGAQAADSRTSVLKLTSSQLQQDVAELAADVLGLDFVAGAAAGPERAAFLASHGATLAGGTSEVQRTILGERVLGLPR
jgi:alkylation response protein AidB-like acyl-CoA dehydrogenase